MKWQILSTPPCSGIENMHVDVISMDMVAQGFFPRLRFFQFEPACVSYGKHQKLEAITDQIPAGWEAVQRPTGGGVVLHRTDLCFSLVWSKGTAPLPDSLCDVYRWIHSIVNGVLETASLSSRVASCQDQKNIDPLASRRCFQNPATFDLLDASGKKILGGAIARQRDVFLYQGSLQLPNADTYQPELAAAFTQALS